MQFGRGAGCASVDATEAAVTLQSMCHFLCELPMMIASHIILFCVCFHMNCYEFMPEVQTMVLGGKKNSRYLCTSNQKMVYLPSGLK